MKIPENLKNFQGSLQNEKLIKIIQESQEISRNLLKCTKKGGRGPVLKIRYHGYHGRGTKGIWGDQRDVIVFLKTKIYQEVKTGET